MRLIAILSTATAFRMATRMSATTEPVVAPVVDEPPKGPRAPIAKICLESACGIDYTPLVESLRRGAFEEADQVTRDTLITLAGAEAQRRGYVYWTEAQRLPALDLATIELLWNHYSDNKFGYTVQRGVWMRLKDFEAFCAKVGWNIEDDGQTRKRRWFGNSEFIYDLTAPKGHLPLTSALRGTQLLKNILFHDVWTTDDWRRDLVEEEEEGGGGEG
ncbi:hypothetical protein CTAYLR_009483 [Chrysophaeum taylorii]|uniref:GUN4-like domain-containing protein n=1 Tax=Chrysophaeum taylorii TaxID=2483200 RepID=A0AAD7UJ33_9STRA|nr:hypothetical protein CTAYLR_009483 [Chrysophaeum taylorii]